MEGREVADVVNDFGRNPIGEGKEEQVGCVYIDADIFLTIYLSRADVQPRAEDAARR